MDQKKEHFSSKIGFLLTAIGSAVGLGVLWKFPFTVAKNGGGLFILSYIFCIVLIGLPLFIGEILLGRKSQKGAVLAFQELNSRKAWSLGGMLGVIASFFIMSFYSVIAGWGLSYILMSLSDFSENLNAGDVSKVFYLLSESGGISVLWHGIFTLLVMKIVNSGLKDGIEYWSTFMMRALFILLFLLVLYNMTLPGFQKAVEYLVYGEPGSYTNSSFIEALGLAFFTLSLGQGIMISYGGYVRKNDNVPMMCLFVSVSVIIVATLAALLIFPAVFSYGLEPSMGTGMVFQTLPFLFKNLLGGKVVSIAFFSLFTFAAITSAVAFVEVVAVNIMDHYDVGRKKATFIVCTLTFFVGIPSAFSASSGVFPEWKEVYGMEFLETIDYIVTVWIIPFAGLITSLFLGWGVSKKVWSEEFKRGCPYPRLFSLWHFFIRYICPVSIGVIILDKTHLVDISSIFSAW